MIIGEPPRTQGDLHFKVFGFPVRISPWFWLVAALLSRVTEPQRLLIWIIAVLLSILIHELGHAFAFRYFGVSSHVVLYHFGGLAVPDDISTGYGFSGRLQEPRSQIIISAAGPFAQIATAFALSIVLRVGGMEVLFPIPFLDSILQPPGGGLIIPSGPLRDFVQFFMGISVYWALLNLVPVYPLDGGQIARHLFVLFGGGNAIAQSLMLSIFTGGAIAFYALTRNHMYLGVMFGMLAYSSYTALQSYPRSGRSW